eukprot:CAMPEP_0202783060 /NCGR_PEP_ID=MMETSP1388-20130828/63784_1 /ASSEMBLY_ACC=CAM_ASM_000864 /TAXON_ID=37098 /ORGANISM="Isochrysis sp, Strain CCMP1244" /LENGTH=99 /DNA_ID=CAMNT_0049452515 /DNA_START=309 /DNA_END=606 /DNA_ORIENTATION=+
MRQTSRARQRPEALLRLCLERPSFGEEGLAPFPLEEAGERLDCRKRRRVADPSSARLSSSFTRAAATHDGTSLSLEARSAGMTMLRWAPRVSPEALSSI